MARERTAANNIDTFLFYRILLGMFMVWFLAMLALTLYHHYMFVQYLPFLLVIIFGSLMFGWMRANFNIYHNFSAFSKKIMAVVVTLCMWAILIVYSLPLAGFIANAVLYSSMILFCITALFAIFYINSAGRTAEAILKTTAVVFLFIVIAAVVCAVSTITARITIFAMLPVMAFYWRYCFYALARRPQTFTFTQWLIGLVIALGTITMVVFGLLPTFTSAITFSELLINRILFGSALITILTTAFYTLHSYPLSLKGLTKITSSMLAATLVVAIASLAVGNLPLFFCCLSPTLAFTMVTGFLLWHRDQQQLTSTHMKWLSIGMILGLSIMIIAAILPALAPGVKSLELSLTAVNAVGSIFIVSPIFAVCSSLVSSAPPPQLRSPVGAIPTPPLVVHVLNPRVNAELQQPLLDNETKRQPAQEAVNP